MADQPGTDVAASANHFHHNLAREIGVSILTGRYPIGSALPSEVAASAQLGVSRPAYREALRVLAAKGLVESRAKSATRVCPRARWNLFDPEVLAWLLENAPDPAFVDDLLALRMVIEPAATAAAAERRSASDLAEMEAALAGMHATTPDSPEGQAADERFHRAIFRAAGSELLGHLAGIVYASVNYIAAYKRERQVERDSTPDHDLLFRAIAERRPGEARRIMLRLISHARSDIDRRT